jgi:hypothetical protein
MDQDLALQREALEGTGVNTIFEEKASGTKRDGRTELQKVLSVLGEGDALVVTRLDRLGRSMRDHASSRASPWRSATVSTRVSCIRQPPRGLTCGAKKCCSDRRCWAL